MNKMCMCVTVFQTVKYKIKIVFWTNFSIHLIKNLKTVNSFNQLMCSSQDTQIKHMKLQRLQKYEYGHLGRWYIKSTLYKRFLN